MAKKTRVLIIDDSVLVRQSAKVLLESQPDIEVMDTAVDPIFAMEKMRREWPDVIVLDIQMPRMDGLSFLKKLMSERPTPVVICSCQVGEGEQAGIEALAAGAICLVTKPKMGIREFFVDEGDNLVSAVRAAALVPLSRIRALTSGRTISRPNLEGCAFKPPFLSHPSSLSGRVVALGASTGGTQALAIVLSALPVEIPGIVLVQHMPIGFTKKFADHINQDVRLEVREAENGQRVEPGLVLIAPAGRQMRLLADSGGFHVEVRDGPLINRHRPSVDCLFSSVAKVAGRRALGVLMTGMGDDGALGMKEMFDAGAATVAEAEETCVVFGMPRAAIERGGAREILPLHKIADRIIDWAK